MTIHRILKALGAYTLSDEDIQLYETLQNEPQSQPTPARPIPERFPIDDQAKARQAVDELPDVFKEPLVLRHFNGLTYEAIAERMNLPVGSVRARIARGQKYLLARLGAAGSDPQPSVEQKKTLDEIAKQLQALDQERERIEGSLVG